MKQINAFKTSDIDEFLFVLRYLLNRKSKAIQNHRDITFVIPSRKERGKYCIDIDNARSSKKLGGEGLEEDNEYTQKVFDELNEVGKSYRLYMKNK